MSLTNEVILRVIETRETSTQPYTSSKVIAEQLDATLEEVEAQLEVMETNGQVRLANTSEMVGRWEARLTPSGRRELGGPATVQKEETGPPARVAGGNVGAVEREHIRSVEAIAERAKQLKQQGHGGLGHALRELTDAITASHELSPEEKDDSLESLHRLSELATTPPEKRSREEVITILGSIRDDLLTTDLLDETWAIWERTLTAFFQV